MFSRPVIFRVSCSAHNDLAPALHRSALAQSKAYLPLIAKIGQLEQTQNACQSGKWLHVNFLEVALMGLKTTEIEMSKLVISPSLSAEYRRTILGLTYRVSSFSRIPEPMLLDYMLAHPPIGKKAGKEFHVVANVRTLALKPFLPGETQVTVIEDKHADQPNIVLASAYRELINLVISGMVNKHYQGAVVRLWESFLKEDKGRQLAVTSKNGLAPIVGLRRQALYEVSIHKEDTGSGVEGGNQHGR
jgi:hypothetical protein